MELHFYSSHSQITPNQKFQYSSLLVKSNKKHEKINFVIDGAV